MSNVFPTKSNDKDAVRLEQPNLHLVQNIFLIWLDESINTDDSNCEDTIKQLRSVVNTIHIFTDNDKCIQFLKNISDDEKICMIISSSLCQDIVSSIHNLSQVDSILIFSKDKKTSDEEWIKEWFKIKGIFSKISSICEILKDITQECERNATSISFVRTDDVYSKKNLNQIDSSFIYCQILKDFLLNIQSKERHFKQFISYCREIFSNNDQELDTIKTFEQKYRTQTPIWWYTYASFLYPMLNRAFRIMDLDIILKSWFFIDDLHRHITYLHTEQFKQYPYSNRFTVYHGQGITKKHLDEMSKTKNGLLSFNHFLFTTKNRDICHDFALRAQQNGDLVGILFVISIDPSLSTTPFACINNASYYKFKDDEILFSIHTVFRICDIKSIDRNHHLFEVNLTLTSTDNDQDVRILTDYIRKETFPKEKGWLRLGQSLLKLGQFEKVEEVHKILLEQTTNEREKATIYDQIGLFYIEQRKYNEALEFYEKSLEIYRKTVPLNYPQLISSFSSIGNVYYQMGEYKNALTWYEKVLEIQRNLLPSNHPKLALSYSNIGLMLTKIEQYPRALSFYNNALEIQQKSLPPNHLSLAASYNNIGAIYNEMRDYSKAFSFYEHALAIRQQSLPPNHPDIALSYSNMGNVCQCIGDYAKAHFYYKKGIEIQEQSLHPNHPDLTSSYNKIGTLYEDMGDYARALSSYEKVLQIRELSLPSNHPHIAESHNNIANVYFNMDEYEKALSLYQKALEIQQQSFPSNHPVLGDSYNNIGAVYDKMEDYPKALSFYDQALTIRQKTLPPNHPNLALSFSNIGVVYDKMGEYTKAFASYRTAIEIQEKSLPPNHPNLASSYNNIGAMYEDMRNYSQALPFYEKALSIRQQSLPSNHPDLGVSYNNVAVVYHYMNDYSKALFYYEKGIQIQEQSLPSNHPDLASSFNKIGAVYEAIGDYVKARSFYKRALDIGQHSLPSDHPHLQIYQKNFDDMTKKY